MATVTLRPNADGTYSRFVEVPNSGFVFGDQAESNDISLWTGTASNGATISTTATAVHHGSYALETDGVQSATEYAFVYKTFIATYATLYQRHYLRLGTAPTALWIPSGMLTAALGWIAYVGYNPATTKWGVYNYTTSTWYYEAGTTAFNAATWYCVELRVTIGAAAGIIQLWIDGVQKVNQSSLNMGTTNIGTGAIGGYITAGEAAERVFFNDCYTASTSAINAESRKDLVDDSSDNTALQVTTSVTQKETFNLEDSADLGTINSVTAYARAKYVTGGGNEGFKIIWKLAATEVQSAEKTPAAAFSDHTDARATDPDGGTWSWADVNSLEIGAIASTLAAGEVLQFSEFYMVVDYTAAGGVSIPVMMHHYHQMSKIHRG